LLAKQTSKGVDVLRGLGALGVIWGHSIYSLSIPVELNGAFWVWIFFSLSGFFILEGFIDGRYYLSTKGYLSFLWNRSLRIMPLYYVALCLGLMFELKASPDKINMLNVIQQFIFLSPLNLTTLSGPLWSVAAIVKFYVFSIFIILLIVKVKQERRPFLLIILFILSIVISAFFIKYDGDNFVQPRSLLGNLHFFIWGMLLAVINWDRLPRISFINKFYIIFSFIGFAWYLNNWDLIYFWGLGSRFSNYVALGGGSLCALSIVFVVMLKEPDCSKGNYFAEESILVKIFAMCGFYSYAIYVYHSILTKANQLFFHLCPGLIYLIVLLLSLPVAFLSYKLIESPIQQFRIGESATHSLRNHDYRVNEPIENEL
jgi:peptidoglycan/LPS O-acetylase OafA/YrhL